MGGSLALLHIVYFVSRSSSLPTLQPADQDEEEREHLPQAYRGDVRQCRVLSHHHCRSTLKGLLLS